MIESYRVKYEKLPKFCGVYGLLRHVAVECGDGVHDAASFQYGECLIASHDRRNRTKGLKKENSSNSADAIGSFNNPTGDKTFKHVKWAPKGRGGSQSWQVKGNQGCSFPS